MTVQLRQFLSKWWLQVAAIATCLKVLLMFYMPEVDLINWAGVAETILHAITAGRLADASVTGVYGGLGALLVPFFWVWTQLPIAHPPLGGQMLFSTSTPVLLLAFLLKIPTLLADIATGILVSKIVSEASGSVSKGRLAFLVWYLNPFNVYWINLLGGMDVIPAFIIMLVVKFGIEDKWVRSGIGLAAGTITRIFPLLAFPFLLLAARNGTRRILSFLAGFLAPLTMGIIILLVSGAGTFTSIAATPETQYWLLGFLGYSLGSSYVQSLVKLTFVVLALQLFIAYRYWEKSSVISLATVSLLALLTAAEFYGGYARHFLWVSPLLTTTVMLNRNEKWLFIATFVTGCLAPALWWIPLPPYTDTLTAGAFWATKATYLLRINFNNISPACSGQDNQSLLHRDDAFSKTRPGDRYPHANTIRSEKL